VREEYRSWHGPSPAFGTLSPLARERAINLAQRKILRSFSLTSGRVDLARRKILWSFSLTSGASDLARRKILWSFSPRKRGE